jgi:hypothetical protein
MPWTTIISTVLPTLLKILNDPAFQSVIAAIEADLNKKLASGTPATAASQQATGLLGAAAILHLTGNPVSDFQAFINSLPTFINSLPKTSTFTS